MTEKFRIPLTMGVAALILALALAGGTWDEALARNSNQRVVTNLHTAYCGSGGIFTPATDYPPNSADKIVHCISNDLAPGNNPGEYANPLLLIWQREAPTSLWYIWFNLSDSETNAVQNGNLHVYTHSGAVWEGCTTFTGYSPYDNSPTGKAYCIMPSFTGTGVTYAGLFWD